MDVNWGSLVIDSLAIKNISFSDPCGDKAKIYVKRTSFALIKQKSNIDFNPDDKFMRSLSSVIHLDFGLSVEKATWCNAINFSQLIKCQISLIFEFDWLETLMGLLQNSPNLKLFSIDQSQIQFKEDFPLSWNEPSSVPKCLSDPNGMDI